MALQDSYPLFMDGEPPYIVHHWKQQSSFLGSCQDAASQRLILYTMTPKELLATCMVSPALHSIVVDFLCYVRRHGLEIEEPGYSSEEESDTDSDVPMSDVSSTKIGITEGCDTADEVTDIQWAALLETDSPIGFCDLPPEIALQIVALLGCVEKARLRRTCSTAAAIVAESFYIAGAAIFHRYGLNADSVRLLQTITGAAISGATVAGFLHRTSDVGDLDIVVGFGHATLVGTYVSRSVSYTTSTTGTHFLRLPVVYSVLSFLTTNGLRINVIESATTNPLDCIGHFQMSCVYGAWLAGGFWHAYARLTESGVTVTTPSRLPVYESNYRRKPLWNLVSRFVRRGFKIALDELPRTHVCGQDFDCPATVRTSNDEGCSYTPFAPWPYSHDEVVHQPSHWSMLGNGCPQGILGRYGVVDNTWNLYDRGRWHRAMTLCISTTALAVHHANTKS
ncbi:hypothetical protein C8R47DRAFT_1215577 [Mycena vitilis]|nr:hypothetical protein C8R47DRAFT_1215577 [Mycena vitilis]